MATNTHAIRSTLYPLVESSMKANTKKFDVAIADFMNKRHESLFSPMPLDRIFYGDDDRDTMFNAIAIDPNKAKNAILNTYYGQMAAFNPRAAKDPLTVTVLCIIRYFLLKNDKKHLELAMTYLAFSGKFYPSIHYMVFPKVVPQAYVMEYVLNNSLNNKFDIKSKGSVFAAILNKCIVWVNTYKSKFKDFDDDDVAYLIFQLHSRIRSFMKNIGSEYYKAYENKDYITYNSDNEDAGENSENKEGYHLANSDSFTAEKIIEKTMTFIATTGADYKLCKMAANVTVKTEELKAIIESILNDKDNMIQIKRVVSAMVYSYFTASTERTVLSLKFINFSIQPKPNTKDKAIIEQRKIIENWLMTGSILYRKRCHRLATKNNYNKAVLMYFAMAIYLANK